jgi:hypothetical protein
LGILSFREQREDFRLQINDLQIDFIRVLKRTVLLSEPTEQRVQSHAGMSYAEPTNEARAEAKLAWTMPCKARANESRVMLASTLPSAAETRPEVKEEEDEVNRDGGKNEVLSLNSIV